MPHHVWPFFVIFHRFSHVCLTMPSRSKARQSDFVYTVFAQILIFSMVLSVRCSLFIFILCVVYAVGLHSLCRQTKVYYGRQRNWVERVKRTACTHSNEKCVQSGNPFWVKFSMVIIISINVYVNALITKTHYCCHITHSPCIT